MWNSPRCDRCGKELSYSDYQWAKRCQNTYGRAHLICFDCLSGPCCPICGSLLENTE
ncbi:MAG: hypothetical protein NZ901_04075 [Geminocystis sp.]|nr:hypothetical protein [Geminocystis sp.]HIK38562.1 hypothetical protein [Geminocystis sp. M7585_C2015_104]MCS7147349.1 hypothetical protein [Geminocystis sp.]MCX8079069.1 hypothetical protein [Geminocystis sp.]MDW8116348.1 hypothetical protein [Geminocystis sp.]